MTVWVSGQPNVIMLPTGDPVGCHRCRLTPSKQPENRSRGSSHLESTSPRMKQEEINCTRASPSEAIRSTDSFPKRCKMTRGKSACVGVAKTPCVRSENTFTRHRENQTHGIGRTTEIKRTDPSIPFGGTSAAATRTPNVYGRSVAMVVAHQPNQKTNQRRKSDLVDRVATQRRPGDANQLRPEEHRFRARGSSQTRSTHLRTCCPV